MGFKYSMIFINQNGAFSTGMVTFFTGRRMSAANWYGIKPDQVGAFIILHELAHVAGYRHNTPVEESQFNETLRKECLGAEK